MNKLTIVLITLILLIFATSTTHAEVKGINETNYDSYVKPIADEYGYNKGECEKPYLAGEEYFYNDYYDHWNVDKVYDSTLLLKYNTTKVKKVKKVKKHKKYKKTH